MGWIGQMEWITGRTLILNCLYCMTSKLSGVLNWVTGCLRLSLTISHLSCAGCVVHVDMHGHFGECVMLWVVATFIVAILFRILHFIVGLLFVVNMHRHSEYFQKSTKTITR